MKKYISTICIGCLLVSCSDDSRTPAIQEAAELRPFDSIELAELVETTREKYGLPAVGVLIQKGEEKPLVAVSGVRKRGSDEKAGESDLWFIGSAAKSMTATLLATFVEDGSVDFATTLIDIFPDYADLFTERTRKITVAHLLSHSAGLRPNPAKSQDELAELLGDTRDVGEQRAKVLANALAKDLLFVPGSDYAYSNTGYILAASVIERIGGKDFETLLAERVLGPLGISNFGFGHPGSVNEQGSLNQPWGHRRSIFRLIPVAPNDLEHINPPIFNSAGNLYIGLVDWSVFVRDQLRGRAGHGALFDKALYERLQLPEDGETGYSLGWGVLVEDGMPVMLTHNGSDGSWFADVRAYPPTDVILLFVTNDGREDDEAKEAAANIRRTFSNRYDPTP